MSDPDTTASVQITHPPLADDPRVTAGVSGRLQAVVRDGAVVIERPRPVVIVMLSGGVDSTYTLVKLLRETDDTLLVHHINFINLERRHEVEADRCRRIVEHCRRAYRPFHYSESTLDHRAFQFFGFDMVAVGFEAGLVAHSHLLRSGRMPERWTIGNCIEEGGNSERWPHVLACVAANCWPHAPPTYFNLPIVSKRAEIDALPKDVLDLTWTCRTPLQQDGFVVACGRCKTCELMTSIDAEPPAQRTAAGDR